MAVYYDYYKTTGVLEDTASYHVRIVESSTTRSQDLCEKIQQSTTLTTADLKGALAALSGALVTELKQGSHVHIEGLGYFSLSLKGEIVTDAQGQPQFKKPGVRTVLFHPEEGLLNRFYDTVFTAARHSGHHSIEQTEGELLAVADELLADRPFFTARQFVTRSGLTRATAYRRLQALLQSGQLRNLGTPHHILFAR